MQKDTLAHRELSAILEEKLATPDPPHGYTARFVPETAGWISSLEPSHQGQVFELLGHILSLPGEVPLKTRALLVLERFPHPQTEALLDAFLSQAPSRHTPDDLRLAEELRERLYDRTLLLDRRRITLKYRQNAVRFYRQTAAGWEQYAVFTIPPDLDQAEQIYDLIIEHHHPAALIACRGDYDLAAVLDEKTGRPLRWHQTK